MKIQIIQDERVLAQKRKIGSDAFQILFYGLLASTLIQQYIYNAPFSQYAVEFVFFISSSFYVLVRNIMLGNNIFSSTKNSKKLVVINSIVSGLTVTVINTFFNYNELGGLFKTNIGYEIMVSAITFICATTTAFVVFQLLYFLNKKKQEKIETKLNDDEGSDE